MLDLNSIPTGAKVIVDGRVRGTTPLHLTDLSSDAQVQIELRLGGYQIARQHLQWQGRKKITTTIKLEASHL